ncbi:helix-turn-helix domain-containing protein [Streptomyces siamensis]|uniref:helix-turn-helix domain-containing protein n=1 Tax=Streptomyces siamensis TaxID=1274986 RepID=UPI0031E7CBD5
MPRDPLPEWVLTRQREVGERIRCARRDACLSQVALAERIGRDHKTVHRWETASTVPSLVDLLLLADVLGVPLPDLVR